MDFIKFTHRYEKLKALEFTTIRLNLKDKQIDQKLAVSYQGRILGTVQITKIQKSKIKEIDLDLLKKDIKPFEIKDHLSFAERINQFYPKQKITVETFVYILFLKWIGNPPLF